MKKKNTTIDDLAIMINNGFEKTVTKEQFETLDFRMVKVEKDLKDIKKQLTDIVYRSEFDELRERVKDLENLLAFNGKKR